MSRYTKANHSVYMSFMSRDGWHVQFLEADLKTALPRKFAFADAEKITKPGDTKPGDKKPGDWKM
jgi:hypothetical protein